MGMFCLSRGPSQSWHPKALVPASRQRIIQAMNSGAENPVMPSVPLALHALHERTFEANRFVYPVLSRRSRAEFRSA